MTFNPAELDRFRNAQDVPFRIRKIGHVVLRASNLQKSVDFYVHFAFEVDTLDEVFLARKRLRERGVPIVFEGRRRAGVQIAVEFLDPDGHHLEIYWGLDRIGADGRVRPKDEWREAHTLEDALENPPPGQSVHLADPTLVEGR